MKLWLLLPILPTQTQSSLLPKAVESLPPGATTGAGWLREQLELQATGLTGELPDFWSYLTQSAWRGGPGAARCSGGTSSTGVEERRLDARPQASARRSSSYPTT